MKRLTVIDALRWVLSMVAFALVFCTSAWAADTTTTFAQVKPSIAVIANDEGEGTGFCVASTATASYYITNAHVVGAATTVTVYRHDPVRQILKGTVIATGGPTLTPDLAIVRVPVGNIPVLRIRMVSPAEGSPVATVGYPSAQYKLAAFTDELVPAIHVGTISSIVNRGRVIEYDAQTLPGNSGGPLIDPSTGDVVGIVQAKLKESTDANVGIGIDPIVAGFLKENDVAYRVAAAPGSPANLGGPVAAAADGPIRTLAGAGNVVVVYDTAGARGDAAAPAISASAADFADKFRARFGVGTMTVDQHTNSADELAEIAKAHNAIMAVAFGTVFQTTHSYANAYGSDLKMTMRLNVGVIDLYGYNWLGATKSKDINSHKDAYSAIKSSFDDLSDQVIGVVSEQLSANSTPTTQDNFFRYALPLGDGQRKQFVGLVPADNGARVKSIAPFSPATDAGLQVGDIVISVNGKATAGLSQEELNSALFAANDGSGLIEYVVIGADGKQAHIRFSAEDIRWFVQRRAATRT